jgi:hygromycin-B 7''-O-kinase
MSKTDAEPLTHLPADIGIAEFDALHDQPERWRGVIETIAARYSAAPVTQPDDGTALVGLVGDELVIKLYPPFLRDHCEFEAAVLPRLHGRLGVPTPALLDRFEHQGWPGHVMTRLTGTPLDRVWPSLDEPNRCALLAALGRLAAEVHALPVQEIAALAPAWPDFIERQRAGCLRRQTRTGLPEHLLAQLEAFIAGPLPSGPLSGPLSGPDVILTGEYTPFNLLVAPGASGEMVLSGMFDFGDGLVGPAAYDWLGPLCFLAAGHRARREAFFSGYGLAPQDWPAQRLALLRLLLLHRYSALKAQIACPGWQQAATFDELAALAWP